MGSQVGQGREEEGSQAGGQSSEVGGQGREACAQAGGQSGKQMGR